MINILEERGWVMLSANTIDDGKFTYHGPKGESVVYVIVNEEAMEKITV